MQNDVVSHEDWIKARLDLLEAEKVFTQQREAQLAQDNASALLRMAGEAARFGGWRVDLATDDRAERFAGHFPAHEVHPIASATIGSRNPVALLSAFWTIWRGVRQASEVIRRIKPDVVIGFGGYPTLPPLYAATRRKVPTIVHEQNAVMGRANRALAARVAAIAGGFLDDKQGAFADKIVVTGNPVRPAVLEAAKTAYSPSRGGEPFRLLVFGGSQGAQFFSDAAPAAIAALPEAQRARLVVT